MAKVIGIDLGTTNSVVAVMEGGSPTVNLPHPTSGGTAEGEVVDAEFVDADDRKR